MIAFKNTLTTADKVFINTVAGMMMQINDNDDGQQRAYKCHADQGSTYGHLSDAIREYCLKEFGLDVMRHGVNWGGNTDWAADIQQAINDTLDQLWSDARHALSRHGWIAQTPDEEVPEQSPAFWEDTFSIEYRRDGETHIFTKEFFEREYRSIHRGGAER